MAKSSSLTIIDDKNLRGIIAPSKTLSKKMLEDLVDFIELSTDESIEEDERLIAEADKAGSWIPAKEVERRIKQRTKAAK